MEEKLYKVLEEIAGKNVLGSRSKRVESLVLAVSYLATQYKMAAKQAKYENSEVDAVFESCCKQLATQHTLAPDAATPWCNCITSKFSLYEACNICGKPPRR